MNEDRMTQDRDGYDAASIVFHWLTAALVLLLWGMAQSEDLIPREWRHGMWSIHITAGAALVLVYLARMLWRLSAARRPDSINPGLLRWVEQAAHALLYALLAATLAMGIVNVAARGWDLFGLIQITGFAADDRALRRSINGWHELAANALLCLVAVHAAAALYHQFVGREPVLARMWWSRRRKH
ncbi:MAG: cytochrome b [Hyphomicrobiales bacterium]|nr:MAG: cytochrome b [Hyphomicrobiales bacterium]